MALSKDLKEKIISRHNEMFEAYLCGDIDGFTAWWADDIVIYGTAISEVFTNKQVAFDFYKSTSDQVIGVVRMENKKINVYEQNGYLILTEDSDFHVKVAEEWMFYHHSRLTSVWSEMNGEWYTTHVHISYPDGYSDEGQQFNPEQLRSENIKLQKAVEERTAELEQKNRELEIDLALDKIRSRSLAMHHSNEILEVAYLVSEKLRELSLGIDATAIILADGDRYEYWIANDEGSYTTKITEEWNSRNPSQLAKEFIKHQKSGTDFTRCTEGEDKRIHWEYLFQHSGFSIVPPARRQFILDQPYYNICVTFQEHISLTVVRYNNNAYSESEKAIVKKFCKVFAQAYRRFLDLETAERQAKEARIETALERVRAKSNAMQQTDNLLDVIEVVSRQLEELGISFTHVNIRITEGEDDWDLWSHFKWLGAPVRWQVKYFDHPLFNRSRNNPNRKVHQEVFTLEEKTSFEKYLAEFGLLPAPINKDQDQAVQKYLADSTGFAWAVYRMEKLSLAIANNKGQTYNEEEQLILKRFAEVFQQSYTRFLDLKKAEEQALEARIEAALEKIRSISMSMQKSIDLKKVVATVFEKLQEFLFLTDGGVTLVTAFKAFEYADHWVASPTLGEPVLVRFPYFDNPIPDEFTKAKLEGLPFYAKRYEKEVIKDNWERNFENGLYKNEQDLFKEWLKSRDVMHFSVAFETNSGITVATYTDTPLTKNQEEILKRFSKVFEQSYTRFLDLQKAEEQAQEAKIEAALERIRSRTMAMQKSEELSVVAYLLFEEFKALYPGDIGVLSRAFVITVDEEAGTFTFFITTADGNYLQTAYLLPFDEPTNGIPLLECWNNKNELLVNVLEGEVNRLWLQYLDHINLYISPEVRQMKRRVNNFSRFEKGFIGVTSTDTLNDAGLVLLKRFTKVFNQTFTRFLDLQEAEVNRKLAVKQAAIDRIRADIASMRTVSDLDRLIPLIWNELQILQISFIRCGIFIMNEKEETINTFLSTPDGKSIASFPLSYHASDHIAAVVGHWQKGEVYINQWAIEAFHGLADSLIESNIIQQREQYLASIPETGIHLHFVPFLQGMLYVGNTHPLSKEEMDILQSVANAFSTAYARYQDFNQLEAAKKEIEKTLQDLKQTQQQLIQAEKMASLGELTAGIAHEIQNPLNFVNNFSEVSQELIDEMKMELNQGNYDEAKQIATDVKENLNKINHHGKRADAIVKGMLQHSRTSAGKKEATDINALCDEYLRLAYHGLRAKDKSFNTKMETKWDTTIGLIDVVPQDIGRVLLNLINNAFYATDERKKKGEPGYEPLVTVETRKVEDMVHISVKDNGMGIPDTIKEKIFQPFFTTKPTGQGTGLGLSLSYDIISKGHGGTLQVDTEINKGTTFIIQLPIAIVS